MENTGQSLIAKDMEITGTIKSAGSVHVDGKLDGEVLAQGDVVIGQSAVIKGNITSNAVTIQGTVDGNIVARDKIEMKSTAKVNGDIKSKRLAVEDGVTFVGKSEVNPSGSAAAGPSAGPSEEKEKSQPPPTPDVRPQPGKTPAPAGK